MKCYRDIPLLRTSTRLASEVLIIMITTCVTLGQGIGNDDEMARWREDAKSSWRKLRDAYSQVELQYVSELTFREGLLEHHVVAKVNRDMYVIEMDSFHNGSRMETGRISGSNKLYAFELSRGEEKGFVLREVVPTHKLDVAKIPPYAYLTWPIVQLDGVPLEEIIEGDHFHLSASSVSANNVDRLFRIEFTRRTGDSSVDRRSSNSLVDHVQEGWILLDPLRHWVVVEFEYELLSRPKAQRISCTFEFDDTANGQIPIVRSFSRSSFDGSDGRVFTTSAGKYEKVVFGPIHAFEFTVNRFGFETPAFARVSRLPSMRLFPLALVIGVLLAVGGWCFTALTRATIT